MNFNPIELFYCNRYVIQLDLNILMWVDFIFVFLKFSDLSGL